MKKIVLFSGLPGAGKSTVSKRVSEKTGAKLVDVDIFKSMVIDQTTVTNQIDPPEVRWICYQVALSCVFGLFNYGVTSIVVMDEVFHLDSLRTQLEVLCAKNDVQVLWVEVRCSFDKVKERLAGRKGHLLPVEKALNIHLLFRDTFEEFPENSPNHIIINNEDDAELDPLVEKIIHKMMEDVTQNSFSY